MSIESREAAAALSDIDDIVRRVRQSRIYQLASLMLILWGALVIAGYIASFLLPRMAGYIWVARRRWSGSQAHLRSAPSARARTGMRSFDWSRAGGPLAVLCLRNIVGASASAHFTPRATRRVLAELHHAGLYRSSGYGSVLPLSWAIGLGITALTLVGYFFTGDLVRAADGRGQIWRACCSAATGCKIDHRWLGLDDIIHQPLRLRLMALGALTALPEGQGLDFDAGL